MATRKLRQAAARVRMPWAAGDRKMARWVMDKEVAAGLRM
jgi:hypothetical protein